MTKNRTDLGKGSEPCARIRLLILENSRDAKLVTSALHEAGRMRQICMSGLMSGERKRALRQRLKNRASPRLYK
jgi:hypothetical protein